MPALRANPIKNITLAVPPETYRDARIWAARHNTSVSALVRRFLDSLWEDHRQSPTPKAPQKI